MVAQSHGSDLRKRALRILCADDDPLFSEVMDRVFSSAGHSVECVGNGTTAWKRMSPDLTRFDVLVTTTGCPASTAWHWSDFSARQIIGGGSSSTVPR